MAEKRAGEAAAPVLPFLPATFAECGVNVPFTTPQLAGTRVRWSPGSGLEGIVPSPSGRGIYVLPWSQVGSLCRPTVYDLRLVARIAALESVTPVAVRSASWAVAAEGLAGRPALHAAQAAIAAAGRASRQALGHLHRQLALESAGPGAPRPPADEDDAGVGDARHDQAAAAFAARHALSADRVAGALTEVAGHFATLGLGLSPGSGFLPARMTRLTLLRDAFAHADKPGATPQELAPVVVLLDMLLAQVDAALLDAAALTGNVGLLLRNWLKPNSPLPGRLSEPEWLLDGWDRLDVLWRLEQASGRPRLKASQVTALLPPLPSKEFRTVDAFRLRHSTLQGRRQTGRRAAETGSELMLGQIAWNETALGLLAS